MLSVRFGRFGVCQGMWSVTFALASMALGCEEKRDVPAPNNAAPGIDQSSDAEGPFVDEDVACETFRDAVKERTDELGCDDIRVAECPELIRPAGTLACTRFTKKSLDECTDKIAGYGECGDFGLERCILVSAVDEQTPDCVPPGAADAGEGDAGDVTTPEPDSGATSEPQDAGSEPTVPDAAISVEAGADAAVDTDIDAALPLTDAAAGDAAASDAATPPDVDGAVDAGEPDAAPGPDPVPVDAAAPDSGAVDAGDAAL